MLSESDLHLSAKGWGRIVLAASASRAGTAWTDHGTARQERGLKHRAAHETRTIPIPPDLVRLLRAHIKRYAITDGRIFQTARGGILQDSAYSAVWAEARKTALTRHGADRWAAAHTTCGTRRRPFMYLAGRYR
jgi:integrase